MWISSFALLIVTFFLPETLGDTILLRRAQRLRILTGNDKLRSLSELKQAEMTVGAMAHDALVRPFTLMLEPGVLFLNLYIACKSFAAIIYLILADNLASFPVSYAIFYRTSQSIATVYLNSLGYNSVL